MFIFSTSWALLRFLTMELGLHYFYNWLKKNWHLYSTEKKEWYSIYSIFLWIMFSLSHSFFLLTSSKECGIFSMETLLCCKVAGVPLFKCLYHRKAKMELERLNIGYPPTAVLRADSWFFIQRSLLVGGNMCCWRSNLGQLHTMQIPYLLYYFSGLIFSKS